MRFTSFFNAKTRQTPTAEEAASELPENAQVKIIYWPPGYFDQPNGGNFIPSSITEIGVAYMSGGAYRPSPGHVAILVTAPAANGNPQREYYLSIGFDKNRQNPSLTSELWNPQPGPICWQGTFADDNQAFRNDGRESQVKIVDFVDATRVKNFIVKFNSVNDHIYFLEKSLQSINKIINSTDLDLALRLINKSIERFEEASRAIEAAGIAAEYIHNTGILSEEELNNINLARNSLDTIRQALNQLCQRIQANASLQEEIMPTAIDIKNNLELCVRRARQAAGDDAYYSPMAGGAGAPRGHSCVSIVADALCYGDRMGEFRSTMNDLRILPTPQAFFPLVRGASPPSQDAPAFRTRSRTRSS